MVEELLQFLIGEIDAQLLHAVELERWKLTLCNFRFSTWFKKFLSEHFKITWHIHQRFQTQQCPAHRWRTVWLVWCPTSGWYVWPSTRTSFHRWIWPMRSQHYIPKSTNCSSAFFYWPYCVIYKKLFNAFDYVPVAQSDPLSQIHFQPLLWGSTRPSAYPLSSNPEGKRLCQPLLTVAKLYTLYIHFNLSKTKIWLKCCVFWITGPELSFMRP